MSQVQLISDVSEFAVWFTFMTSLLFTPVTSLFWPWWKSTWGWNIVSLEFCIALALLAPWLRFAFGIRTSSNALAAWLEVAAVLLCGMIVAWRAVMIYLTQRAMAQDSEP